MNKNLLVTIFLIIASTCLGADSDLDGRFVGKWAGKRAQGAKCQFLAWITSYTSDHKISVTFFSDPYYKNFIKTENGTWMTAGNRITIFMYPEMSVDVYYYHFLNRNKIEYKAIYKDKSGDCQDSNYKFIDIRISDATS